MAERSKALRSGRSPLLWAWLRIPLLTELFLSKLCLLSYLATSCPSDTHSVPALNGHTFYSEHKFEFPYVYNSLKKYL